jgi:hypothetical protein
MLMSTLPAQAGTDAAESSVLIVENGDGKSVILDCEDLAASTHPYAAEACAEIEKAQGDITHVPGLSGQFCTGLWQPVSISVTGLWQGNTVSFSDVASNIGCGRISHMHVFYY